MRVERLLGVLITVIGAAYVVGALAIRQPPAYAAVGPRTIPIGVGLGMVFSGVWLALAPGPPPGPESEQRIALDWPIVGVVAALLLGYALALRPLGFIVTNVVFLTLGAQTFGERRHLARDLVVGVVFAVLTYLLFAHGLRIQLPGTLPESVIDAAVRAVRS